MNRRDEVRRRIEDASSGINDSTCWDDTEWNDENGKSIMDRLVEDIDRIYGVLPDDGEVATYEWMQSIGADVDRDDDNIYLNYGGGFFMAIHAEIPRGQFRRLCEALGVELQERKDGE